MHEFNWPAEANQTAAGAVFSDCRRFRWLLWRRWTSIDSGTCRWLNVIMLNGSKADERANDPTVERQVRRAQRLGFGGLYVTNLFGLMATNPEALYREADPTGQPQNGMAILETAQRSDMVICGWGNHGKHLRQGAWVRRLLDQAGIRLHYLRMTKADEPEHPLYLKYSMAPIEWKPQ